MSILTHTSTDAAWFEAIYSEAAAARDENLIPWASDQAAPALVNWLNAVAPSLIRCGARVAVVGCGAGQDARALITRGYDVTAFDWSPTAIEMARRADPQNAQSYFVADLFDLPERWRHRFDLVVEVKTVQSLSPDLHAEAIRCMSELVSAHGRLLVICASPEGEQEPDGPPWPLREQELLEAASLAGFAAEGDVASFREADEPKVLRLRALLRRAT